MYGEKYYEKIRKSTEGIDSNLKHELSPNCRETLCNTLLKLAGSAKTPEWTMEDLDRALGKLKKEKARDPLGLANDIFRPEVAGDYLKLAEKEPQCTYWKAEEGISITEST
jgi:hypothetical protein